MGLGLYFGDGGRQRGMRTGDRFDCLPCCGRCLVVDVAQPLQFGFGGPDAFLGIPHVPKHLADIVAHGFAQGAQSLGLLGVREFGILCFGEQVGCVVARLGQQPLCEVQGIGAGLFGCAGRGERCRRSLEPVDGGGDRIDAVRLRRDVVFGGGSDQPSLLVADFGDGLVQVAACGVQDVAAFPEHTAGVGHGSHRERDRPGPGEFLAGGGHVAQHRLDPVDRRVQFNYGLDDLLDLSVQLGEATFAAVLAGCCADELGARFGVCAHLDALGESTAE
jgi:hypothetical protein